jgi:hypothetical protein
MHNSTRVCPKKFALSTIIPIPKNKRKSLNDFDNYRGIALSSVLGKTLDRILLKKHLHVFETSDLQFGFKKKHSTAQCTFMAKELIQYYTNAHSSVYSILLDASKAFDRVKYIKLFRLLSSKGLCPMVARFLALMYVNQVARVKWADYLTPTFDVTNGIKQGGVLAPILFTLYIDELLTRLKASGVGCHLGHIFMGALAYADDLMLLAPTLHALKRMLSITNDYSREFNISFNPDKSKLVIYDKDTNLDLSILFNGCII